MAFCPTCKREFTDATVCPDDKVTLVGELPFQTIGAEGGTWVEIASVRSEDEAQILKGFLDAEGIPAQIESLRFSMEPVNFGMMGDIRVYVDAQDEQRAIELLQSREDSYDALTNEEGVVTDDGQAEIDDDSQTMAEGEEQ